jgi:hypothetical protein
LENLKSDLVNSAIVSATGAHWEEATSDVWNWNTDTRSTAIILDTFAQLWPEAGITPNAVRWLMVAREGSGWETRQETVWSLLALTHWMEVTGELDAAYQWSFSLNGIEEGTGTVRASNVTVSETFRYQVADLLDNEVNRLIFGRSDGSGRLYYAAHLTAYLPVEAVEPLSRGIIVSRRFLDAAGNPIVEGNLGDLVTVEITVVAPNDLYYLTVEDFYPAGAEAVDTSLLTERTDVEGPRFSPDDPLAFGWGWWWFSRTVFRDEKAVLYADYVPRGTYQYTYQLRLGLPGVFQVIPPVAFETYFPEVYGRGAGSIFTIAP